MTMLEKIVLTAFYIFIYWILKLTYVVFVFVVAPRIGLVFDLKRRGGTWALITGGTSGIGAGYAAALARRGINVLLLSHNLASLAKAQHYLQCKFPQIQVKAIQHDLAEGDAVNAEQLRAKIGNDIFDDVGIIVNAASTAGDETNFGAPFVKGTPDAVFAARRIFRINIGSVLLTTGTFLPEFEKRKRGVIINISAGFAAVQRPVYGFAAYGASRAAITHLTEGLRQELASNNACCYSCTSRRVIIQTVTPLCCAAFDQHCGSAAEAFANKALYTVGHFDKTPGTLTSWILTSIVNLFVLCLPSAVVSYVTRVAVLAFGRADDGWRQGVAQRQAAFVNEVPPDAEISAERQNRMIAGRDAT